MNARTFQRHVLIVIAAYAVAIGVLFALRALDVAVYPNAYATFKDAVPLVIAIPAAWLGYCLQRRQSYLKDVRDLWSKLVGSMQEAVQYTHLTSPEQSDYAKVLKTLSTVTEELRSVFLNVGESESQVGLYPFERLKEIHAKVSALGFGDKFTSEQAGTTRREIVGNWKLLRKHYLSELERGVPAEPDSPFLQ